MTARYAIYYAPAPGSPFHALGSSWLGRDAWLDEAVVQPPVPEIYRLTSEPRRYGLHATLKAPFQLAKRSSRANLRAFAVDFAVRHGPVSLPGWKLVTLDGFLALAPSFESEALQQLAAACVMEFDAFRAPARMDDITRRARLGLTRRQNRLLHSWGYPYVLDQFRLHVTLTNKLEVAELAPVREAAERHFASLIDRELILDAIAIFCEPHEGAAFLAEERFRFAGAGESFLAGAVEIERAMSSELLFAQAKIVTADEVVSGNVLVRDGAIADISRGPAAGPCIDVEGAYLLPGLVELHTDHLESHYRPRPGVAWPAIGALLAHDAQIAAAGITTVFDALRAGSFDWEAAQMHEANDALSRAIVAAGAAGMLRADHRIHLRCELPCPDTLEVAEKMVKDGLVQLLSVMDHTPGERQFVQIEKFRDYYLGKKIMSAEMLEVFIAERRELHVLHAQRNRRAIVDLAARSALRLASHDDATVAHVSEAVADGVIIAEFPTTAAAAGEAHARGLAVLMGAPNLVRGGSHSGNISTSEVARSGCLDLMSSDYVPASLLHAAFSLPGRVPGISLPQAVKTVSANCARAAGLDDRGEIAVGKRADLIVVRVAEDYPVVRSVWRAGQRVL